MRSLLQAAHETQVCSPPFPPLIAQCRIRPLASVCLCLSGAKPLLSLRAAASSATTPSTVMMPVAPYFMARVLSVWPAEETHDIRRQEQRTNKKGIIAV